MSYIYKTVTCPKCNEEVTIYASDFSGFGNREWESVDCPHCGAEKIYKEFTNKILETGPEES